ncbi:chain length determinant protein [Streptomyces roseicoloratus]|uniref:Chain length determinant protein n=1 Tax=Streptomyces roseicoloratus TaxID=2508722 RepID=A0ABY9S1B1_9ACTN|nr:chain length determinant protein [Streptomyces roseicoloratus]WMX48201.1 chain length determinant protein [Streptomyces roseicoloratus]
MDLAEIFRVMCRRWYVLVPGLLLTAGLTAGAWLLVPVSYESQSTVAMLNSRKGTEADGNPFLSMEPSLTGMADSLARNVNSDASKAELKARGLDLKYEAKIADNAQGPLLWLTVTGEDADAVLKGNRTLMAFTSERLKQLQADQAVASDAMIRITTIVPPQDPQAQLKSKVQYLVMAAGLGIVLSLVATFFAEARRRGPRRAGTAESGSVESGSAETGSVDPGAEAAAGEAEDSGSGRHVPAGRTERPDLGGDLRDGLLSGTDAHTPAPPAPHTPAPSAPAPRTAVADAPDTDASAGVGDRGQQPDQPTVQLPVLPVAERRSAKRPPSWVK